MPLDPDSAALVARLREINPPRYETLKPDEARAASAAARQAAAIEPPAIGETRDLRIPTDDGFVDARLYRPVGATGTVPGLVFFHGGGWVLGDLDSHDILCRRLSNAAHCAVLAVDYRLAPESKFPAAVNDTVAATRWAFANASALGIDAARLGVGGDSAGANLAAVVALNARDGGEAKISFQLLIYPVVELAFSHPSHKLDEAHLPVLGETMIWFRDHYLEDPSHVSDWRASPLLAKDFTGLPPAYVLTAGYDPLMDEGAAYARKLEDANVAVDQRYYPGQIHGFLTIGTNFTTTGTAIADIGQWMKTFW
jgi:acetyl esterase